MDSNYLWSCSFDLYVSRDFLFRNETVTRVIFSKDSSRIPTGYTRWLRNFFGAFYWIFKNSSRKVRPVYSSVPNRHACTFINFEKKFPPARLFHPARLLVLVFVVIIHFLMVKSQVNWLFVKWQCLVERTRKLRNHHGVIKMKD